jgi:thiol-disulfide isomerase/thioredoxin
MKKLVFLLTVIFVTPAISTAKEQSNAVKDFSFFDSNGIDHQFSDYKGKWILVNYWASYCPPCLDEMPDIERFYRDNKDKFTVLGIDAGGSSAIDIRAFMKDYGISYPLIPMQESTLFAFGEIRGIPTSFVISPKGNIIKKYVGIITYDDLDYHVNPPIFDKKVTQK